MRVLRVEGEAGQGGGYYEDRVKRDESFSLMRTIQLYVVSVINN